MSDRVECHRFGRPEFGLLALASVLLTAAGCGHGQESTAKADAGDAIRPVVVTVSPLSRRSVERRIEIEGTLKAWEEVTLSAKKGGRVLKVLHDMGDQVAPGTPLVELDPVDADLAVLQAEAKFLSELSKLGMTREQAVAFVDKYGINESLYNAEDVARRIDALPGVQQTRAKMEKTKLDYNRQESMYRKNAGTLQDLQNAENEFKQAEAALNNAVLTAKTTVALALSSWVALKIAQQDRKDMIILAPEPSSVPEGVGDRSEIRYAVSKRMVHEGQRMKDGDPVVELVIANPIRLWANVPERYRGVVRLDAPVRLAAQSRPDETFEGRVVRINPSVDTTSRTFQVEAIVPNSEGFLRPGGFARGEIITARSAEAVVVPIESVYSFAGVTKVFLVEQDRARGYSVRPGRQYDRGIEVIPTEGELPAEGRVVDTGQSVLAKLAEGTPVLVREPGSGGPKPTSAGDAGQSGSQPVEPPAGGPEPAADSKPAPGESLSSATPSR